jgi:plastocyanin
MFSCRSYLLSLFAGCALLAACGADSTTPDPDSSGSPSVIIQSGSFIPETLSVSAGDTVFFLNYDSSPQLILSESSDNAFDDTGVLTSSPILTNSVGTVTVPDDAVAGDVILYYNSYLQSAMATPNGRLEVE